VQLKKEASASFLFYDDVLNWGNQIHEESIESDPIDFFIYAKETSIQKEHRLFV
jgi:hypothetical protein